MCEVVHTVRMDGKPLRIDLSPGWWPCFDRLLPHPSHFHRVAPCRYLDIIFALPFLVPCMRSAQLWMWSMHLCCCSSSSLIGALVAAPALRCALQLQDKHLLKKVQLPRLCLRSRLAGAPFLTKAHS